MSESYESRNNPISSFIGGLVLCVASAYAFWLNENRFDYGRAAKKTTEVRSFKKSYLKKFEGLVM